MKRMLQGIVPPLVTPLLESDRIDGQGLESLIEHVLGGGVHGIFILGTTGEGPSLSYKSRYELVERTCRQVEGRVPVIVGITDTSISEAAALASHAEKVGAAAVVSAPPYYFSNSQDDLISYFSTLSRVVSLPLFLYNMPSHTKTHIEVDTLKRLTECLQIVGVKDSSGNMVYFHKMMEILNIRPDWSILVGPEELLGESVLLGGHGGVNGGANLFPQLYVELYNAAKSRDIEKVKILHKRVIHISKSIYNIGDSNSGYLRGLKSALSQIGLCSDLPALPFCRFSTSELARLQVAMKELACTSDDLAEPTAV